MSVIMTARRRQADDLHALLEGGRAGTREAAVELAPLVALAGSLTAPALRPRDDFRTALRAQLLTEAATRAQQQRAVVPAGPVTSRRSAGHRVKQAVAAVAVTAMVAGVGAAAASTRALPGDSLYGLKRQIENVQLALARGDVGRGRELLEQADARLGEAEALAAGADSSSPETRTRLSGALTDMDTALTAAAEDLTRAYRETGNEEPMQLLGRFAAERRDRLDDLLALLDPSLRDQVRALSAQLAALDQQVVSVLGRSVEAASTGAASGSVTDSSTTGVPEVAATGGAGPAAGSTSGRPGDAGGAGGAVEDVVGAVTGSGGTATTGGKAGPTGGGGVLGGSAGTASAATPLPTVSVPVPVPTGRPLVTDPVGTVTSAAPLPSSSLLPPVSGCVPVPPLTAC
ncbi:MAG: DUF5667 domain-containing protein [Sporichthyaceae bacterium]